MSAGFRWAWGLLDGVARAVAVAVLVVAVALPSFLTNRPVWESLLVAAALLIAVFAEGTYRVWQEARVRNDVATNEALREAEHAKAQAQLASAIQSGNVLRVRNHDATPLGFLWRDQVEALVKNAAGPLEASRFTHSGNIAHWLEVLDDLAKQVGQGRELTPSASWDAYVERMDVFRLGLDVQLSEGEHIRGELFDDGLDAARGSELVRAWLRAVDEVFSPVPRLRDMLQSDLPHGMAASYEGLSEEESRNVWHVDVQHQRMQPLLTVVTPYVEALKGAMSATPTPATWRPCVSDGACADLHGAACCTDGEDEWADLVE